jgi:hypothetical protein
MENPSNLGYPLPHTLVQEQQTHKQLCYIIFLENFITHSIDTKKIAQEKETKGLGKLAPLTF